MKSGLDASAFDPIDVPGPGRLAFQALLQRARIPRWRIWAGDAAIEKKDILNPEDTPGVPESLGVAYHGQRLVLGSMLVLGDGCDPFLLNGTKASALTIL